jgi:hypothetical protein
MSCAKYARSMRSFHPDNDGPYYWHIKSGTIQREVPVLPESEKSEKSDTKQNINKENDVLMLTFENSLGSVTRSSTSSALDLETEDRKRKNDMSFKSVCRESVDEADRIVIVAGGEATRQSRNKKPERDRSGSR